MAATHNLPRRRPANPTVDSLADSLKAVSLQKTPTFQVMLKEEPEVLKAFLQGNGYPNLPARSATCPKSLEDLLIGPGERRTAELLQRVDDAIARRDQLTSLFRSTEGIPRSYADETGHDDKDSGIGSSIDSEPTSPTLERVKNLGGKNNTRPTSAITRSFSGEEDPSRRQLSPYAAQQVDKYLTQPILREAALQLFHPLVESIPARISSKEIGTLRDLEKTLIYLAPDYSSSPKAFQVFCEVSIRCLHATVNSVHDSDRCLPQDRPYSTGYFIDLVEQMRRYASILAATRENERQIKEEANDEMEDQIDERIELHGGMSQNGKPAVLVRVRGDERLNLADGQPIKQEEVTAMSKRPAIQGTTDDDSALRSMARRKKGEPVRTYYCNQPGCTKHFKRPCDLTKHIKTHERPYKCPELGCKYHELGWPTEKECERHVNDKHSDTPTMYKCVSEGCPYTSKRESNCKQHMEKAHNIPYVRSKSKGKGKAPIRVTQSAPSVVTRGDSVVGSPLTPAALSPSIVSTLSGTSPALQESPVSSSASSIHEDLVMGSNFDFNFSPDFISHFNTEYLEPSPSMPITPAWTDDRRDSTATSITNYSPLDIPMTDFDNAMFKTETYDFNMFTDNMNMQPSGMMDPSNDFLSGQTSYGFTAGGAAYTLAEDFQPIMNNTYSDDFQLYSAPTAGPSRTEQTGQLDSTGSQFAGASQGQTDLLTLFPELNPQ